LTLPLKLSVDDVSAVVTVVVDDVMPVDVAASEVVGVVFTGKPT